MDHIGSYTPQTGISETQHLNSERRLRNAIDNLTHMLLQMSKKHGEKFSQLYETDLGAANRICSHLNIEQAEAGEEISYFVFRVLRRLEDMHCGLEDWRESLKRSSAALSDYPKFLDALNNIQKRISIICKAKHEASEYEKFYIDLDELAVAVLRIDCSKYDTT